MEYCELVLPEVKRCLKVDMWRDVKQFSLAGLLLTWTNCCLVATGEQSVIMVDHGRLFLNVSTTLAVIFTFNFIHLPMKTWLQVYGIGRHNL